MGPLDALSCTQCRRYQRPDTDIAGALRIGMRAALVRTGRFRAGSAWPDAVPRPDWDLPDLSGLLRALEPLLPCPSALDLGADAAVG